MALHPDGPERFCYDAVEARAFTWDTFSQLAVLRSLEVEYSYFDSNPACAATCVVGTQSFEEFLARGAGATVPDAVHAEVRDYLVSRRTPGPSTCVSVGFESLLAIPGPPAETPWPAWWALVLENAPPSHPGFPGPDYASSFDDEPGAGRRGERRMLVTPGAHALAAQVSVRYPAVAPGKAITIETLRATLDVVIAAGQQLALRCEVDLPGRSATLTMTDPTRGA